uniref:Focal_AT domain-containing protein n=1 Tax=Mesocestoides corti TaxID=53468 RepID=A0A5K3FQE0_MESCO
MIYLRRRQKYASNAIQTRNAASVGANGAKVGRGPPPGGFGKQGTHAGSGDYPSSTKAQHHELTLGGRVAKHHAKPPVKDAEEKEEEEEVLRITQC